MIGSLRGIIQDKRSGTALIDVGGLGYQVTMSLSTFVQLPSKGEEVFLHTYMHVREDAMQLFGFSKADEKELFIQLISVSNIGPKVALSVLSNISSDNLARAIGVGDVDLIATIPGIGKKTAQRLVLELKEKLAGVDLGSAAAATSAVLEARYALVGLGYSVQEADQALRDCGKGMDAEECVKAALKRLG